MCVFQFKTTLTSLPKMDSPPNSEGDSSVPHVTIMSQDELDMLDKKDLVAKVISMQEHIKQLKYIIQKQLQSPSSNGNQKVQSKANKKAIRPFEYSRYKLRHIFLKFLYLGWNYDGFVVQEDTLKTIEAALFEALLKVKLIRNKETANYHRCGRTDKGVSAFCQVVSLTVRSQMKQGEGLIVPDDYSGDVTEQQMDCDQIDLESQEIDYVAALNGVLPKDIRAIAWAPLASTSISARFDCRRRQYHYLFPRGQLQIAAMNEACQHLIGQHDFRNLCKMDINNGVINYIRNVFSASVSSPSEANDPYSICIFTIEASAFLWHQIRCIMGVLFLVGQGNEEPSVVGRLLDVETNPSKPQYSMAADLPLVLYAAHYDASTVPRWVFGRSSSVLQSLIGQLHEQWARSAIESAICKSMIDSLADTYGQQFGEPLPLAAVTSHLKSFLAGVQPRTYKTLFQRPLCDSLASRLEKRQEKKRIKLKL